MRGFSLFYQKPVKPIFLTGPVKGQGDEKLSISLTEPICEIVMTVGPIIIVSSAQTREKIA